MSSEFADEQKKNLRRFLNHAFRHVTEELIPAGRGFVDPTIVRYDIVYNKKLDHIEILKIVTVNKKLVTLEPPLWISQRHYDPQNYSCNDKECRTLILCIYSQIPDIQNCVKKIMKLQKS